MEKAENVIFFSDCALWYGNAVRFNPLEILEEKGIWRPCLKVTCQFFVKTFKQLVL